MKLTLAMSLCYVDITVVTIHYIPLDIKVITKLKIDGHIWDLAFNRLLFVSRYSNQLYRLG